MKKSSLLALSWTALLLGTLPVLADARDDVLANTARCGRVADPRSWLDCYYGAAQPMRAQLGLTPAPAAQTRLVPGSAVPPAQNYAAPQNYSPPPPQQAMAPPLPARKKSGSVMTELFGGAPVLSNMHATAYSFDKKGIFTITLADGEVWQQLEDDDSYAQWSGPASRLLVTIKTGSLSSNNLSVNGDNRRYKVQRVR